MHLTIDFKISDVKRSLKSESMDEERMVEVMRQFFNRMQTNLVAEVVNKLTEVQDSISESSSEKDTIPSRSPTPGASDRQQVLLRMAIVFSFHLSVRPCSGNLKVLRIN